ncbi:hypothetical protein VN24_16475 [Paenibacillus beijingensis]|uniref:MgtC/SapB/SrpB/YhiD N-terminal domain-containing protein n=2 Tax=Paenibacillus beijingensis TaxID=1126833 RepID=A0A0D5NSB9_9BACL|nr:hypothetical protein VN24_16475 [Paenibacillus beijingensis]
MAIRLFTAMIGGGLIGLERQWSQHHAGLRTHMLVALGSAIIMLLSIYGFSEFVNEPNVRMDPARLGAQVISGIGFLGAGTIIRNGLSISGLTTAASLWVSAAIGLSAGAGFYFVTALATVLIVTTLFILKKVGRKLIPSPTNKTLHIIVEDLPGKLAEISSIFEAQKIKMGDLIVESQEEEELICIKLRYQDPRKQGVYNVIGEVQRISGVRSVGTVDGEGL